MRFPVDGTQDKDWKMTQDYSEGHPGWDIAPKPAGSRNRPLYAPQAATVASKGYVVSLEGHWIQLRVHETLYYYFGHLDGTSPLIVGQRVAEGARLGTLGMSGLADGIHTHHEVRLQHGPGRTLDPAEHYKQVLGGNMATKEDVVEWYKKWAHRVPNAAEIAYHIKNTTSELQFANGVLPELWQKVADARQ